MGFAQSMHGWDEEFCARLAARNYRVIRFDNRDAGPAQPHHTSNQSDIAAFMRGAGYAAPYTLADMAGDSAALLDAIGVARAHVVGASMGGMIAQLMAIQHPQRVQTLTSVMSTTGDPGLPPATPEGHLALVRPPPAEHDAYLEYFMAVRQVMRAGDFPGDAKMDRQRAERSWERGFNPAGVARQFTAVKLAGSRRQALAQVTAPTLVIHGDSDPLLPLEHGIATAQAIPGARLHVVRGMGHALPLELWPEIIDAIARHARAASVPAAGGSIGGT
jgi:pimeloyl-ACP methyl ester carboxylesterase